MLRWGSIDEAQKKIQEKCELVQKIGAIVEKYQFGKHKISFYKTGKMMVSEVDEIETFLTELLG